MASNNNLAAEDFNALSKNILDNISRGLESLKQESLDINQALEEQSEQLDNIIFEVDRTDDKLQNVSKICKTSRKIDAVIGVSYTALIIGSSIVAPIIGPVVVSAPFVAYYIYRLQ